MALVKPGTQWGVLRIYDLDLKTVLAEMWSDGVIRSLEWDQGSGLLLVTCYSRWLPACVPELAPYDSFGCPNELIRPTILVAIRPERVAGVLAPLSGDAAHPTATVEWALALAPVRMDHGGRELLPDLANVEQAERPGSVGKVLLRLRDRGTADPQTQDGWAWVHISAQGSPVGALEYDDRTGAGPDPALERTLVRLDLPLIAGAWQRADPLLRLAGSVEEAERRLRADPSLSPAALDATLRAVRAANENWRWQDEAAERLVESEGGLGAEPARALEFAERAVRIHDQRCPRPESCIAGWMALHTRAVAEYRAGALTKALATLDRCNTIHAASNRGPTVSPLDAALSAMVRLRLGQAVQARTDLETARSIFARSPDLDSMADATRAAIEQADRVLAGSGG